MRKHFIHTNILYAHKVTAQETSGRGNLTPLQIILEILCCLFLENDFMEIKSDRTFYYELKAKNNLSATGNWFETEALLCFNYSSPSDTTRYYNFKINENELTLNEDGVNYSFIKKETIKSLNKKTKTSRLQNIIRGIIGLTTYY